MLLASWTVGIPQLLDEIVQLALQYGAKQKTGRRVLRQIWIEDVGVGQIPNKY